MIEVDVRLYASLEQCRPNLAPGDALLIGLPEGTKVAQLLENELGISTELVRMVVVNGIAKKLDYALQDGDRVAAFPPIAGG